MQTRLKALLGRHLPWWLVAVIGLACVALGLTLIADPFRSLGVLSWLTAAALVLAGVGELTAAGKDTRPWLSRLAGIVWLAGGCAALAWPGVTVRALTLAVGLALLANGILKLVRAALYSDDDRLIQGLAGATNVLVGALVLAWQDASVLVLAVLFGIAVTVFGVGQVAVGLRLRGGTQEPEATRRLRPRRLRLAGALGALVLALGATAISISVDRGREGEPGTFYAAPDPLPPGPPGTLIRSEVIDGYHPGATTYRVLYKTTGYDGAPTAASGLVLVPDRPAPTGGRTVVAYTHGTVGVESRCAPSLATPAVNPLFVEGGGELLDAGYVVAAPDYEGLGTRGPHPYLVGPSEAMSTLDAVRAARELAQAHAGADIVVWGHSQGGHAALFTGQLASSYAPELHLKGVAAGAPVPDLVALLERNLTSPVGKVLIAMALASWSRVYDDAGLDRVLEVGSRRTVERVSSICLYRPGQILGALPGALLLGFGFLSKPVWEVEPWRTIAAENTPGAAPIPAPLLVVQGTGDGVVFPEVTERFVQRLCRRGDTVSLRLYPGAGHVETSSLAVPDVVAWLADRVAGKPVPATCG